MRINIKSNNNRKYTAKWSSSQNLAPNRDTMVVLRQPGRFTPDNLFCTLVYNDPTVIRAPSSTSKVMNYSLRSSAYDPDPLLGGGSIPGYAELSNLYKYVRVEKINANIQVANLEQSAVYIAAWWSTDYINPNSLSETDIHEYASNIGAQSRMVGSKDGQSLTRFNTSSTGTTLYGPNYITDPNTASLTSAVANKLFYLNIGAQQPYQDFDFGVGVKVTLKYHLHFFNRRTLET